MAVGHYALKAKKGAVKLFELCLHPRRYEAENLLQQGMSIRRSAKEVGIGQAALHRHWRRHTRDVRRPARHAVPRSLRRVGLIGVDLGGVDILVNNAVFSVNKTPRDFPLHSGVMRAAECS
jgi:hypothetical protein